MQTVRAQIEVRVHRIEDGPVLIGGKWAAGQRRERIQVEADVVAGKFGPQLVRISRTDGFDLSVAEQEQAEDELEELLDS